MQLVTLLLCYAILECIHYFLFLLPEVQGRTFVDTLFAVWRRSRFGEHFVGPNFQSRVRSDEGLDWHQ